jgi:hypothetical protein
MNRALSTFLLVAVLAGLLTAAGIALQGRGYGFGALGVARLDGLANAATFIPLAAIYAACAMLMMVLPLRAAGFVYTNGAVPVFGAALVLLATIVGVQAARFAFGDDDAPWRLVDWRFVFAGAIIGVHLVMNALRRDVLMRTVFFVVFTAAMLACLFWTFDI